MKSTGTLYLVLSDLGLGGAERVLLALSEQFQRHYAVHFICLRQQGALQQSVAPGITVSYLSQANASRWRIALVGLFALWRLMRSEPNAIVLATGTGTNLLACAARLFARRGARLVIREACSSKNSESKIIAGLKRLLYRFADGMIGVSDGVAAELKILSGIEQQVTSIPNPVDVVRLNTLASIPDKALAAFPHPFILTVGRLVPQKNTGLLIDAYVRIANDIKQHLVIIGGGPLETELRQQIAGYGLQKKIHLLGEVTNPHPWYKRASMFVLSSGWEGYPNVLIEALGHGLKAVATDCDFGPRQILENGRYGSLVQIGDAGVLASAIHSCLASRVEHESWDGSRFSEKDIAMRYLAFMESC